MTIASRTDPTGDQVACTGGAPAPGAEADLVGFVATQSGSTTTVTTTLSRARPSSTFSFAIVVEVFTATGPPRTFVYEIHGGVVRTEELMGSTVVDDSVPVSDSGDVIAISFMSDPANPIVSVLVRAITTPTSGGTRTCDFV